MLLFWLKYIFQKKSLKNFDYETEAKFRYTLSYPFNAIICKIKAFVFKNKFNHLNSDDKFFLFPLHFYPEASILVWATYLSDQLSVIKNIAFSLPFPYKLYVKEHPMAQGTRAMGRS